MLGTPEEEPRPHRLDAGPADASPGGQEPENEASPQPSDGSAYRGLDLFTGLRPDIRQRLIHVFEDGHRRRDPEEHPPIQPPELTQNDHSF